MLQLCVGSCSLGICAACECRPVPEAVEEEAEVWEKLIKDLVPGKFLQKFVNTDV